MFPVESPLLLTGAVTEDSQSPDLTPIIDVVVALLGTLMMLVGMQFVFGDVELAELQRGASTTPPSDPPVVLTLTRDGTVLWDGQPVEKQELPNRLAAIAADQTPSATSSLSGLRTTGGDVSDQSLSGSASVIIAGDRDVSLGQAVELWSLVKSAGLHALMAAEPAETP